MAWLSGFLHRKSHVINAVAGAGTNYQVKITVHYGAGVDALGDVYLNSQCLTHFGDIRFTGPNGATLLDYWMESKVDSDNAVFWVEVADSLESDPAIIYIYYGKADATTTSNGVNTFIFFDDFNVLNNGDLNGQNDWIANVAFDVQTTVVKEGAKAVGCTVTIKDYASHGVTAESFKVFLQVYMRTPYPTSLYPCQTYIYEGANQITGVGLFNGTWQNLKSGGWEAKAAIVANTWYKFKIALDSASTHKIWLDDVAQTITTSNYTNVATAVNAIKFQVWQGSGSLTGYWDLVIVGKYVSPEPSHGAWGSEETNVAGGSTILSMSKVILDF